VWVFLLGLAICAALAARYVLSTDGRAAGLPKPPSLYENIGGVDDFPIGVSRLRDDVWVLRDEAGITAIVEDPRCPYSLEGERFVDCRGRDLLVVRPVGPGASDATGPFTDMLARLCTWVYPPGGDLWVYFEPWPGSQVRFEADGSFETAVRGCPR
jgi:hypothetical protein